MARYVGTTIKDGTLVCLADAIPTDLAVRKKSKNGAGYG